MLLDKQTFSTVVEATPLISIDLVVRNAKGLILLGERLNRPAQGYWFVPGGRILKGEPISEAFKRLTMVELGVEIDISTARYVGLYEHFYDDSVLGEDISTHYVVNGFEINLPHDAKQFPKDQHSAYQWMAESELLLSDKVHVHSKWYFEKDKGFI